MEYWIYGIVAVVGLALAAMASWKVVFKGKSSKVIAKNGSVAVGRDYIHGDNNKIEKK